MRRYLMLAVVLVCQLAGCGGGGGGSSSDTATPPPPVNTAPSADAGADQQVAEGMNVALNGSGQDGDGTITSYSWTQLQGPDVSLTEPSAASTGFVAPEVSETVVIRLELAVTDNDGANGKDTVDIVIEAIAEIWEPSRIDACDPDANISPALRAPADLQLDVGQRLFEPSIIFTDETFTWLSRAEAGPSTISSDILKFGGYASLDGGDVSLIYDDGTHGDAVASDGLFTRSCLYVPSTVLGSSKFIELSNLWVLQVELRGSESAEYVRGNVRVNDTGFFIELGDDFDTRYYNHWQLHSPELCTACEKAWQIAGDVFDFFAVTPRDPLGGAGYVRVHDNIEGTGFTPPCESRSYCYNLIDGEEHQKLTGIIWSGWPGLGGLNHEIGHGLLGMETEDFPAPGAGAWNAGDGFHLDSDTTLTGELAGPLWDPDRGWPYSVLWQDDSGERFETYLARSDDGTFRIRVRDEAAIRWSDILLYMMGLLGSDEVTEQYYKLVSFSLNDCSSEEAHLVCRSDLVTEGQTIAFTVADFINHYGSWSAPGFFDPKNINLGVLNISDRPHTHAEVVWLTKVHRDFASTSDTVGQWATGTSWHRATGGLSSVNINASEFYRAAQAP